MKFAPTISVFLIVVNEFCERFCFYGLRSLLYPFLTCKLNISSKDSTSIIHAFYFFCYLFSVPMAIISDSILGKFSTIFFLSLIYMAGTLFITLGSFIINKNVFILGLFLVSIGTGMKPLISSFGGDQVSLRNINNFFRLFYFFINTGATLALFLVPIISQMNCNGNDCYTLSFSIPTLLFFLSIIMFLSGSRLYVKEKPNPVLFNFLKFLIKKRQSKVALRDKKIRQMKLCLMNENQRKEFIRNETRKKNLEKFKDKSLTESFCDIHSELAIKEYPAIDKIGFELEENVSGTNKLETSDILNILTSAEKDTRAVESKWFNSSNNKYPSLNDYYYQKLNVPENQNFNNGFINNFPENKFFFNSKYNEYTSGSNDNFSSYKEEKKNNNFPNNNFPNNKFANNNFANNNFANNKFANNNFANNNFNTTFYCNEKGGDEDDSWISDNRVDFKYDSINRKNSFISDSKKYFSDFKNDLCDIDNNSTSGVSNLLDEDLTDESLDDDELNNSNTYEYDKDFSEVIKKIEHERISCHRNENIDFQGESEITNLKNDEIEIHDEIKNSKENELKGRDKNENSPNNENSTDDKYKFPVFIDIESIPKSNEFEEDAIKAQSIQNFKIVFKILLPISLFWMLYDQQTTTWIEQGKLMTQPSFKILPAQMQVLNAILSLLFIPFLPLIRLSYLKKMSLGLILASLSFFCASIITFFKVNILFQIPQYILLTAGEVLVNVTGLEFVYIKAPDGLKSISLSLWLLTVAIGNFFVMFITRFLPESLILNFLIYGTFAAVGGFYLFLLGLEGDND
ncbi:Peptide transporter family 1 [Dictyocoela muelleri]|nr:Peptide transporter family 1 [Dictyocoela muelleri]